MTAPNVRTIWTMLGAHVHLDRPPVIGRRLDGVCLCREGEAHHAD